MASAHSELAMRLITAKQQILTIVPLTDADQDRVYTLEVAAHTHPWSRALVQSSLQRYHCWGVTVDDQLIGFAVVSCVVGEAELLDFVISPACQGQGVGKEFMLWLQCWLSSTGAAKRFFLEVRESNEAAIAVYQTTGFAEVGVRPNYYPSARGREDAILMAMELVD